MSTVTEEVRPRLRGRLHLAVLPLVLVGGSVLVIASPTGVARAAAAVFAGSALLLFGGSAAYHCGAWTPTTRRALRRLDHCNIYVLIAGSCTAYALLLLGPGQRWPLLVLVWSTALIGISARLLWPDAPTWLSPPLYVLSGCGVLLFLPALLAGAGRLGTGVGGPTLVLMAAGSLLYVVGAVVYGTRRPDPWPRWFGFHEVFHTLTVLAFASHSAGITLVTWSLR